MIGRCDHTDYCPYCQPALAQLRAERDELRAALEATEAKLVALMTAIEPLIFLARRALDRSSEVGYDTGVAGIKLETWRNLTAAYTAVASPNP